MKFGQSVLCVVDTQFLSDSFDRLYKCYSMIPSSHDNYSISQRLPAELLHPQPNYSSDLSHTLQISEEDSVYNC